MRKRVPQAVLLTILFVALLGHACIIAKDSVKSNLSKKGSSTSSKPVFSVWWRYRLSDRDWIDPWPRELARPAVEKELVVAGGRDGLTVALKLKTRRLIWSHRLPAPILSEPLIQNQRVFIADGNGYLNAFEKDSGKLIWRTYVGDQIFAKPVLAGDKLVLRTASGQVVALDASTGKKLWDYVGDTPSDMSALSRSGVLVHNNRVIAPLPGGTIVALSVDTGSRLWEFELESDKLSQLLDAVSSPLPLPETKGFVVAFYNGGIVALSFDGQTLWYSKHLTRISGAALLTDNNLGVVSAATGFCKVSIADGSTIWCLNLCTGEKAAPVGPVVWGKRVLVSCNLDETGVYVLSDPTQSTPPHVLGLFAPGKGVYSPPVPIDTDSFAVISNAGYLYIIDFTYKGLPERVPMHPPSGEPTPL